MLNSIIKNYLSHNKRLVIPNFGTFVKKDDSSQIIFMELLKKDDGVLVSLVMSNYGAERAGAVEIINSFIISVKQNIANNTYYTIQGVGTLRANEKGNYSLDVNDVPSVSPSVTPRVVKIVEAKIEPEIATPEPAKVAPAQSESAVKVSSVAKVVEQKAEQKTVEPIDVTGLNYSKPRRTNEDGTSAKRTDMVMIIALIAAGVAILAMLYGLFFSAPSSVEILPQLKITPDTVEQISNSQ